MTIEEQEDIQEAASEQPEVESQEHQEEPKMVPLAALQAERKKRQEFETRNRVYEELMNKQASEPEEPEDPEALVTKGSFKQEKALTKREILEQVYQDMNPEAVQKINMYLKPILDKKPWLAASVDTAMNRLARANEIIDDYMHLLEEPKKVRTTNDAAKIIANSQKPGNPVTIGKSAQPTGTEYLKSIQGKKEFREYRQKVLNG
jgi:NADH dehydrogenase/NADH:ubiquinone oxidoreductase subunit G